MSDALQSGGLKCALQSGAILHRGRLKCAHQPGAMENPTGLVSKKQRAPSGRGLK